MLAIKEQFIRRSIVGGYASEEARLEPNVASGLEGQQRTDGKALGHGGDETTHVLVSPYVVPLEIGKLKTTLMNKAQKILEILLCGIKHPTDAPSVVLPRVTPRLRQLPRVEDFPSDSD